MCYAKRVFCRHCDLLLTSGLNFRAALKASFLVINCFMTILLIPTEVNRTRGHALTPRADFWSVSLLPGDQELRAGARDVRSSSGWSCRCHLVAN